MEIIKIGNRDFETNGKFIYTSRPYPVGTLEYKLQGNPNIWGNAALEYGEEEVIFDAARLVGGGNMINLGDLRGGSAILMAQGLRHNNLRGHVYTVDIYGADQKAAAENNMIRADVMEDITILNTKTCYAIKDLKENNIFYSFVFIDADHSYAGVENDWVNYSPLIKGEGLIAFHDTNQQNSYNIIEKYVTPDKWELMYWVNRIKIFKRI